MAKSKKYKKMSLEKLIEMSDEIGEELVDLRLKHSQGKLRDTANIKKTKKKLARINTYINKKAAKLIEDK
jgi:ribosomal protein L29